MTQFFVAPAIATVLTTSLIAQSQATQELMRRNQEQSQRMQLAMIDAQAKADHPNDNKLNCDDMQAEMIATMQDPTFKANVAQTGETAQQQLDDAEKQRGAAKAQAAAGIVSNVMMRIASSFMPGMGMITGRAQAEMMKQQMAAQEAKALEHADMQAKMMDGMIAMMPQLMRAHRVMELGQAKKCGWVPKDMPGMPMTPANGGRRR